MSTERRELVTDGDPDERFPVPTEDDFSGHEFMASPPLREVCEQLLALPEFEPVSAFTFSCRWKAKGGKREGKATLGKLVRCTGLLAHYSQREFVLWLAADHVRERKYTRWQVEALVYHELTHAAVTDEQQPMLVGHDFEGFRAELERYGCWRGDLSAARESFQMALPMQSTLADAVDSLRSTINSLNSHGINEVSVSAGGKTVTLEQGD